MRKRDEPVIYESPVCAAACKNLWEIWCRGCNGVFCKDHIAREKHNCANRDQRPPVAAKPEKKSKKSPTSGAVPPATLAPEGPDLFGKSTPNGIASLPSAH